MYKKEISYLWASYTDCRSCQLNVTMTNAVSLDQCSPCDCHDSRQYRPKPTISLFFWYSAVTYITMAVTTTLPDRPRKPPSIFNIGR